MRQLAMQSPFGLFTQNTSVERANIANANVALNLLSSSDGTRSVTPKLAGHLEFIYIATATESWLDQQCTSHACTTRPYKSTRTFV